MNQTRRDIEAFVRRIVIEIETVEATGVRDSGAIADHFNATGLTTRKGRPWTAATVAKFRASPGARRFRSAPA